MTGLHITVELWLVHFSFLPAFSHGMCLVYVRECSQSQCIPLAAKYPSAAQPQTLSEFRCLSGNPVYPKLPCQVPSYILHAHRLLFYGICPQLPLNHQLSVQNDVSKMALVSKWIYLSVVDGGAASLGYLV